MILFFLQQNQQVVDDIYEKTQNLTPFSSAVYGFLIFILLMAVIILGYAYNQKDKLLNEITKESIKAVEQSTFLLSPENRKINDEMLIMKIVSEIEKIIKDTVKAIEQSSGVLSPENRKINDEMLIMKIVSEIDKKLKK